MPHVRLGQKKSWLSFTPNRSLISRLMKYLSVYQLDGRSIAGSSTNPLMARTVGFVVITLVITSKISLTVKCNIMLIDGNPTTRDQITKQKCLQPIRMLYLNVITDYILYNLEKSRYF